MFVNLFGFLTSKIEELFVMTQFPLNTSGQTHAFNFDDLFIWLIDYLLTL